MRLPDRALKHRCLKDACPFHAPELPVVAKRWPSCLPETLLDRRPQSLPV